MVQPRVQFNHFCKSVMYVCDTVPLFNVHSNFSKFDRQKCKERKTTI